MSSVVCDSVPGGDEDILGLKYRKTRWWKRTRDILVGTSQYTGICVMKESEFIDQQSNHECTNKQ